MSTQRAEFFDLAEEMFEEFADFAVQSEIRQTIGFDYATQAPQILNQTQGLIPIGYKTSQIDGELVKVGDLMLVGLLQKFSFKPRPDNTTVEHSGIRYRVNQFETDPARAVAILHVRRL